VVELGPIVTPLRTPKVPTVANGTVNVSVAKEAFPLTCRELVGLVVPVPIDKELEMYTFPRT
jgi:hypothetical protein